MHNDLQPIALLNYWLEEEKQKGSPNPQHAVLSTVTRNAVPHSRVVAVREINTEGLLIFSQRGTRKIIEMEHNPLASLTFWFALFERQVSIDGAVVFLTEQENNTYWNSYPREAQIRFCSYAPTSAQPIAKKQILEDKKIQLERDFQHQPILMSEYYCGFRIKPERMVFYTYRRDELSDVIEYRYQQDQWCKQILSP